VLNTFFLLLWLDSHIHLRTGRHSCHLCRLSLLHLPDLRLTIRLSFSITTHCLPRAPLLPALSHTKGKQSYKHSIDSCRADNVTGALLDPQLCLSRDLAQQLPPPTTKLANYTQTSSDIPHRLDTIIPSSISVQVHPSVHVTHHEFPQGARLRPPPAGFRRRRPPDPAPGFFPHS
jgi:hypothetical protein